MPALRPDRTVEIREAVTPGDIASARELLLEYAASLGFDLCFQDFEREVASLPGDYAPPEGALLLAVDGAAPVGCAGLRPWGDRTACEMKRLYLRPAARGLGAGRALVARLLDEARARGYRRVLLDTVPGMDAAIALYRAAGFREVQPYRPNPIPGALYMELEL